MSKYHIAQLNIATLLASIDSPQLSDFVANLDREKTGTAKKPGQIYLMGYERRR